jgi:hypothetical protein
MDKEMTRLRPLSQDQNGFSREGSSIFVCMCVHLLNTFYFHFHMGGVVCAWTLLTSMRIIPISRIVGQMILEDIHIRLLAKENDLEQVQTIFSGCCLRAVLHLLSCYMELSLQSLGGGLLVHPLRSGSGFSSPLGRLG